MVQAVHREQLLDMKLIFVATLAKKGRRNDSLLLLAILVTINK